MDGSRFSATPIKSSPLRKTLWRKRERRSRGWMELETLLGYVQGLLDLFPLIIVSVGGGRCEIHHTERGCFSVCNRIR